MTILTRICIIGIVCREAFTAPGSPTAVIATKLPCCSQFACASCMAYWLSPFRAGSNTCVHCRAILFSPYPPHNTLEGLSARTDILKWRELVFGVLPDASNGAVLKKHLYALAEQRLCRAFVESRHDLIARKQRYGGNVDPKNVADVNPEERSILQELWLRKALLHYLAIELKDGATDVTPERKLRLQWGLSNTLEHLRPFLEFDDEIREAVD